MSRAASRPRLLFLCQTLPYPPDGGVWIRSYHVLRLLARTFDVTALCFERIGAASGREAHQVVSSINHLRTFADTEVFKVPQMHSRARYALDHLRSLVTAQAYTRYMYDSAPFAATLRARLAAGPFDVAHFDSLTDLSRFLPVIGRLPAVCVHHNVESVLLSRRAAA